MIGAAVVAAVEGIGLGVGVGAVEGGGVGHSDFTHLLQVPPSER
jgi:hypothetical protein